MTTHPRETSTKMQELIASELELNGVNLQKHPWLASENITREIVFALVPEIHEGKIQSYGILFAESVGDLEDIKLLPFPPHQTDLAHKLADGEEWFVLYEKNQFYGLAEFKDNLSTELQLIRSFPISGGLIIQRNSAGQTKFFQGDSLVLHDNRRWLTKPNVKAAAWKVSQCVANIDKSILNRILEFAFHLVSPTTRVGAILVWFLKPPTPEILHASEENADLSDLHLSISNDAEARMICHLLSQVDGATFFDPKGNLIKTGVQLKYSETSRKLIPEFRGTRHTSSIRSSYDLEDTLVITVSEDGPVTVFSSGANIADLQIYSAHKKARLLRDELPERSENIKSKSFEISCPTCGKHSMIEQVELEGHNETKQIACSTCKQPLFSAVCFSLEGRPFKRI